MEASRPSTRYPLESDWPQRRAVDVIRPLQHHSLRRRAFAADLGGNLENVLCTLRGDPLREFLSNLIMRQRAYGSRI